MTEELFLSEIEVRFRRPLVTSAGSISARRSVIVRVTVDDVTGWGEAPAFPSGRFGTSAEAFESLSRPHSWEERRPRIPIAAAALEAARADAAARAARTPLYEALGASGRPVVARHPMGLLSPTAAHREAAWIDAHGITAVKVKISPGRDLETIRILRSALPSLDIGADANGSYASADDPVFGALADMQVSFVEQPFPADAVGQHARLRERALVPVCIDESVTGVDEVARLVSAGAADQVAVKVNRHGIGELRSILDQLQPTGVGVRIGGTFDTSVGRLHLLAVAGLPGVVDAAVGPPAAYLTEDIAPYPVLDAGRVAPWPGSGIGVDPFPDVLDDLALRTARVHV